MPRATSDSTSRRSASPSRNKKTACQYCFKRKVNNPPSTILPSRARSGGLFRASAGQQRSMLTGQMKCDMQDPRCGNCEKHDKQCIPVQRQGRPRPTHERIDELEGENTKLRAFLNHLSGLSGDDVAGALNTWTRDGLSAGPTPEPRRTLSPERTFQRQGGFSAHGPTSALFDSGNERDFAVFEAPDSHTLTETQISELATAKCAEARHMELINLASGKLDFDGVPPDLAVHLLALHWNRQHFAFLISYRPLFTRDMACAGPYFSKLLLNAIFFSVAKFSDRPEVFDDPLDQSSAGQRFLRRVKELLGEALDQSSIPTIQAMLLLSSSLFAQGHQSAAWLYSGIAMQMIFDLGLNYDCIGKVGVPGGITAEEFEIRRRIVWAAFIIDKIISLYQGRPVSFDEERMHVPHRFLDRYEEQEIWMPFAFSSSRYYPGQPAQAISTFSSLCSLSVIMGRIITQVYADRVLPDRPAETLQRLSASLDRWKASLPTEITYDSSSTRPVPPPHVVSLNLMYHTLVTLLHRPFVEASNRHSDPGVVELCWARCEEAATGATNLLSAYRTAFTLTRAPYLVSYTTFVAATIHVRIAAQRGSQSDAARLLTVCIEALEENSATNPGVRRMFGTINALMERLNVSLPGRSELTSAPNTNDAVFPEHLDLSAIIRSFGGDLSGMSFPDLSISQYPMLPGTEPELSQDNLYGFLGFSS